MAWARSGGSGVVELEEAMVELGLRLGMSDVTGWIIDPNDEQAKFREIRGES